MTQYVPEKLFAAGLTDLISVSPPGAQLTPKSTIDASMLGKCPARKLPNGLWAGYDWRKLEASAHDVRQWCLDGANVGLRADRFPGVDVDCTEPQLAQMIVDLARARLGDAPVRTGRAPKRLLMYRTDEPFSRMRLWIRVGEVSHLVEVLGQGQQFVVHGTHPGTQRPYEWAGDPCGELVTITRDQADAFLVELAAQCELLYGACEREGDGRPMAARASDQQGLRAPSFDAVREAVALVPNSNAFFPARDDYLRMGYAIRASAGPEHEDAACALFAEWAAKWEGNDRAGANDPDVVLADWRRMREPYAVGWSWLAGMARQFGFNDAALDFDALEPARPEPEARVQPPYGSDQWLATLVVQAQKARLRYVPERDQTLAWDGFRWQPDAVKLAERIVRDELTQIADGVLRHGVTPAEKKEAQRLAVAICSAGKVPAVWSLVRVDAAIAVSARALDHDQWTLCTPTGLIDLKTGEAREPDQDALCTKSTTVAAAFGEACPEWRRFLGEATDGDEALQGYLQRLAGYCLTGSTREQHVSFIYGNGGNGKSVFLNALVSILGDYAKVAAMSTFTASHGDKHSTDVADLMGARLVAASETEEGKRWDGQRVKSLSGGERITARFVHKDNFTYEPTFKLLFIGNHKPESRDVDDAMQRRLQMVPFTVKPKRVDLGLAKKLQAEAPAILAWMIEGCLAWQRDGLCPPPRVQAATADYFDGEDALGRFLRECVTFEDFSFTETRALFGAWREWCGKTGEWVGKERRFSELLATRGIERGQHSSTRRAGFKGIRLDPSIGNDLRDVA